MNFATQKTCPINRRLLKSQCREQNTNKPRARMSAARRGLVHCIVLFTGGVFESVSYAHPAHRTDRRWHAAISAASAICKQRGGVLSSPEEYKALCDAFAASGALLDSIDLGGKLPRGTSRRFVFTAPFEKPVTSELLFFNDDELGDPDAFVAALINADAFI